MNLTQIKCLLVLAGFAIIGFGPISPTCLIGMYVVAARPRWFLDLIRHLYTNKGNPRHSPAPGPSGNSGSARLQCFLSLLGLFIVDILPFPVTSTIAIPVVLVRPRWFYELVETIYGDVR